MKHLVYNPAGHDEALRGALVELGAGHWRAARDLLAVTGQRWALRTSRTQVLAVAAARSDVIRVWLREEPGCYDARLMSARVAVERALRARRRGHSQALTFEARARERVWEAIERGPGDPVGWVCLLALAQLDTCQERDEHRVRVDEMGLPSGPWGLLNEVHRRDPYNREAYYRFIQFLLAREARIGASLAAVHDLSRLTALQHPPASPLLLPAHACMEERRRRPMDHAWRLHWASDTMVGFTLDAFHGWFHQAPPVERSVADLSLLAYAAWAGGRLREAAEVFAALEPYAARDPWASVHTGSAHPDPGEALLLRARRESYASRLPKSGARR